MGGYDKTIWRFYTYAGNNQFTENPPNFDLGRGYWINVRTSPGDIVIEGATTPSYNRNSFFEMTLENGWNQVGNPYPVEISWDETKAGNSNIGPLKIFNGTSYSNESNLLPFQGGFVKNDGAQVTVKVRFKGITTGGRTNAQKLNSDLSRTNWAVPIIAVSKGIENQMGGVGMHEKAKVGFDEFDDWNPPRFIDYAELSFENDDVNSASLAKDMVPSQEEYVWEFKVISSPGTTVLNWENEVITGGKDLFLFDMEDQYLIDMKKVGTYSFASTENRKFKIYFGNNLEKELKPTAVTLGKPFPNPTTSTSSVRYTLPGNHNSYKVSLEVFNSIGKRISGLVQGDLEPGFYTATWNAEANPNGLYFYRLTVFEDGKFRALIEKIIINR